MTSYEKLNEMYKKNDMAFKIAIKQVISWGTENASKIKEKEIENAHINKITKKIYKYAREMAKIENEDCGALIKFCIVEKLYDTKGFKPRKRK